MPLERSHGKLRPTLPRSSDLRPVQAVGEPSGTRGPGGRFAAGNKVGRGRGYKALIRKQLGTDAPSPLVEQVHREARTHYSSFMRDLPHGGDSVASLVVVRATYTALLPQLMAKALAAGIDSKAGRELLELAMRIDQRCERLAVTSLDVAQRMAEAERRRAPASFPWLMSDNDTGKVRPASISPTEPGDEHDDGEPPARHSGSVSDADDAEVDDDDESAAGGHAEADEE